jgi:hypothetical protein
MFRLLGCGWQAAVVLGSGIYAAATAIVSTGGRDRYIVAVVRGTRHCRLDLAGLII